MSVKFLKGALSQYEDIKSQGLINEDTFYYIYKSQPYGEDDGLRQLYLGENRLSNASELAAAVERIAANETDIANLQTWADLILKEDESAEGGATGIIANMGVQIGTNQKNIAANAEAIEELEVQIKAITGEDSGSISDIVDAAIANSEAKTNAAIKANTDAIDAIEADYLKAADKTELEGKITAEETRATEVEGGLNTRLTAVEEDVNTFFADADLTASAKDTLKEIQEYINSDATAAAEMTASINGVKGRVDTIEADYLKTADKTELTNAINGKVAQADHDTLAGRVTAVEGAVATKAESSVVTGIDERVEALEGKVDVEKVTTAIATAKGEATSYTDTEIAKLSNVYDAKGAAATAEQNAKDYADGLASNYDAAGSAATAESNAKSHAETKATEALNAAKAYTDAALVWETVE